MKQLLNLFLIAITVVVFSCSETPPDNLILIKGGSFKNTKSNYFGKTATMQDFYIGKYEVTQKEWMEVMGNNPSEFKGDNLPVETVSWYDCIEYCNKRSIKEDLAPVYKIDSSKKDSRNTNDLDDKKWIVTANDKANGYRLPTEMEWEYAAGDGQMSKSYVYSGSNKIDEVAWYWRNAGDKYLTGFWSWPALEKNNNKTKPTGSKQPNALGLHDMSGNVREWCWDWDDTIGTNEPPGRIWKGGGWIGAEFCCEPSFRAGYEPNGMAPDQGFRVCRTSKLPNDEDPK